MILTLSRRIPLSYRNQSIDLHSKSMNWFLYDNGLRLERVKHLTSEFGIDKLEILKTKDVYPFEWVDTYKKFKHLSLPEKKILLFIIKRR